MSTGSAAAASFFLTKVDSVSEAELDSLPYGVIQLDATGTVLRYNAFEAGLSGLNKQKVVGKNFFKQVAPAPTCGNSMDGSATELLLVSCTAPSDSTSPSKSARAT